MIVDLQGLEPSSFQLRTFEDGEVIFLQGQPADHAYVILRGHADVVLQNASGEMTSINRLNPGEMFGELAILTQEKSRTATVVAIDRCELVQVDRDVFERRLSKTDPLIRFVLGLLSQRLVKLTGRIVGQT